MPTQHEFDMISAVPLREVLNTCLMVSVVCSCAECGDAAAAAAPADVTAPAAAAAAPNAAGGAAPSDAAQRGVAKHSAADFDAEAVPLSSFMLNGQDYSKERSLRVRRTMLSMIPFSSSGGKLCFFFFVFSSSSFLLLLLCFFWSSLTCEANTQKATPSTLSTVHGCRHADLAAVFHESKACRAVSAKRVVTRSDVAAFQGLSLKALQSAPGEFKHRLRSVPPKRTDPGGPVVSEAAPRCCRTSPFHSQSTAVRPCSRTVTSASGSRGTILHWFRGPLQDIAAEFWVGAQRSRKQRLVSIDGHAVLRENNYDINSVGAPSWSRRPSLHAH